MFTSRDPDRSEKIDRISADLDEATKRAKASWKGYHEDPETGEIIHSKGTKWKGTGIKPKGVEEADDSPSKKSDEPESKKKSKESPFANKTTFAPSKGDAMMHTDSDKKGVRGSLPKGVFARTGSEGELRKDPRKKWYPVSKARGWASAAGSLRQAYERDPKIKQRVMTMVKRVDWDVNRRKSKKGSPGDDFRVDPSGGLHNDRAECKKTGKWKKGTHPAYMLKHAKTGVGEKGKGKEFDTHGRLRGHRVCRGVHGAGGGAEFRTKFNPHTRDKDMKISVKDVFSKDKDLGDVDLSGLTHAPGRYTSGSPTKREMEISRKAREELGALDKGAWRKRHMGTMKKVAHSIDMPSKKERDELKDKAAQERAKADELPKNHPRRRLHLRRANSYDQLHDLYKADVERDDEGFGIEKAGGMTNIMPTTSRSKGLRLPRIGSKPKRVTLRKPDKAKGVKGKYKWVTPVEVGGKKKDATKVDISRLSAKFKKAVRKSGSAGQAEREQKRKTEESNGFDRTKLILA